MGRLIMILFLLILGCSNDSNNVKFQPIADQVKVLLLEEITDAKSIDTLYLFIRNGTEFSKNTIQWAEYQWAATEAKNNGTPDSTILQMQADEFMEKAEFWIHQLSVFSKSSLEKVSH